MSNLKLKSIKSRLIAIIESAVNDSRRFKDLEEMTGISGATWRTFWNKNNDTVSGEMINAVSICWPQYAFWLATGITDPDAGHVAPVGTENLIEVLNEENVEATKYFKYQISLLNEKSLGHLDLSTLDKYQLEVEAEALIPNSGKGTKRSTQKAQSYIDLTALDEIDHPEYTAQLDAAKKQILSLREKIKCEKLAEYRSKKIEKQGK